MPELDALRGLAALAVVLYHVLSWNTPASGRLGHALGVVARPGWLGVDVFFVLSGFLITGLLLDAADTDPHYYRNFYVKRFFRILPLYYASALGTVLLTKAAGEPLRPGGALLSLAFLTNVSTTIGVALPVCFGVYWSLAVEEHFYVVWPGIVRSLGARRLAWFSVAILVASPVLRWIAVAATKGSVDVYSLTPLRLDGLALGAWIAVLARTRLAVRTAIALAGVLVLFGTGVGTVLSAAGHSSRTSPLGAALQFTAADLIIAGVFIALLVAFRNRTERSGWSMRLLGTLGDVSFFLYLNHLVVAFFYDRAIAALEVPVTLASSDLAVLIRAAVVVLGTTGAALLSRRWLEVPAMNARTRFLRYR